MLRRSRALAFGEAGDEGEGEGARARGRAPLRAADERTATIARMAAEDAAGPRHRVPCACGELLPVCACAPGTAHAYAGRRDDPLFPDEAPARFVYRPDAGESRRADAAARALARAYPRAVVRLVLEAVGPRAGAPRPADSPPEFRASVLVAGAGEPAGVLADAARAAFRRAAGYEPRR